MDKPWATGEDKPWATADPLYYGMLKESADKNKKYPTDAEFVFWQAVKAKNYNIRFRRQYIIGQYIVDFVDLKSQTIIELDGGYHYNKEQIEYDKIRTEYLNKIGFTVLRFKNEEVINDIDDIISKIIKHIESKIPSIPLTPKSPPEGEI